MQKGIKILAAFILGILVVSCSSVSKMAEMAKNVKVTCDPAVLQVVAGNIDANLTVTYPKGYFNKKAILEVTPVLVYQGGEATMAPFMYQGTKVRDNYKVISSEGQTVTEKVHFVYAPGMEKAHLELRGVVKYKKKSYKLPVRTVAVGCNTTYMVTCKQGKLTLKADNYQDIINQTAEGQILYNINSSDVRGNELKSKSMREFKKALDEIKSDSRKTLKSAEVLAYASPDGTVSFNDKLSVKRAATADKALNKLAKGHKINDPTIKGLGEDWEGFKELVSKSNIEDKDLILRVLSMYSDPAVRMNEIKNMSQIFTSLKKTVLPELRRARFIANVEYQNYTSAELLSLIQANIDVLDEEALLRAATLVMNNQDKIALYNQAIKKYDSDRAMFNKGAVLLSMGDVAGAEKVFEQVKTKDADLYNALGLICLYNGQYDKAESYFEKSNNADANVNLGIVYIYQGKYNEALKHLQGSKLCAEAYSYLLTNQPEKVFDVEVYYDPNTKVCLKRIIDGKEVKTRYSVSSPSVDYAKAIAAARLGQEDKMAAYLGSACRNASLKDRVKNDIEFSKYTIRIKE